MLSVLVIDDERSVRETLAEFLSTLGHDARVAESSAQGIRLAGERAPDIVLVDLRLPDGEGLALLESFGLHASQVGVVMLAGRSDVSAAIKAMRSGAVDYLEKPVRLDALEASLLRTWELVRTRRENVALRALDTNSTISHKTSGTTMIEAERRAIEEALKSTGGNKLRAAKLLGIARSTLLEKLKRFDAVM